jgi:hypothetical protein
LPLTPIDITDKLLLLISKGKRLERQNDLVWWYCYYNYLIIIIYFYSSSIKYICYGYC